MRDRLLLLVFRSRIVVDFLPENTPDKSNTFEDTTAAKKTMHPLPDYLLLRPALAPLLF